MQTMLNGPVWENANGVDSASNRSSVKPIAISIACNILLVPKNGKREIRTKCLLGASDTTTKTPISRPSNTERITKQIAKNLASIINLTALRFESVIPKVTQSGIERCGASIGQKTLSHIGLKPLFKNPTRAQNVWDAKAFSPMRKFERFTTGRRGYASTAGRPMIRRSVHSTSVTVYPFSTKREET